MAELNGYVPKELKRDFKILCAAQERSMSEVLTELIQGWINANKFPAAEVSDGGGNKEISD